MILSVRFAIVPGCLLLAAMLSGCTRQESPSTRLAELASGLATAQDKQTFAMDAAESNLRDTVTQTVQSTLDKAESRLHTGNVTHLDLSLGIDARSATAEAVVVYRLAETPEHFLFNQSSVSYYDTRGTFNVGLGHRYLNSSETLLLGSNVFIDYEAESGHRRASVGVEALSASDLQFRANYYHALSSETLFDGVYETALHGRDLKLTYQLPFFLNSDLYVKNARWFRDGYHTTTNTLGLNATPWPQITLGLASEKTDDDTSTRSLTLTYSLPLNRSDTAMSPAPSSLRAALYQPVQRENRIKKTIVRLGVTFSGYSS